MTTTNTNSLNREQQPAGRWLGLCLCLACLVMAWTAIKPTVKTHLGGDRVAVGSEAENAPYDLAHDANYRTMVLFYTTSKMANALPF